jgi:hypothetical protein
VLAGQPDRLKLTGSAEDPTTFTVAFATRLRSVCSDVGSTETEKPMREALLSSNESTTPSSFSTNSYVIFEGDTRKCPNPYVLIERQAATQASVRHV